MTTFLVIGVVGLALLLVSLVVGDLFDGAFDALTGDVFSSAVIGAFVAATGFGAAAAQPALGTVLALPVGAVTGVAFAWFAWWLTRLLADGSSDATPGIDDTVGRDGKVVTPVPEGGFGVVDVLVGGHVLRLNARADHPIEPGTPVHVTGVLSPTAVTVAPVWPELT
ncbi:NfeD family protein [Nocardioides solisilvae]|uniref:NfeD family protein n=1 Tax=Nocardioides solisilvae TaxID=1542435 RepID=UPI000D74EB0B|nr:NfeD family protein [Nocardioides solisilvae]